MFIDISRVKSQIIKCQSLHSMNGHGVTNWILLKIVYFVIMWEEFEPIWISLDMGYVDVYVGCISYSYKCAFFVLMSWPYSGLLNNINMISCELSNIGDPWNIPCMPFILCVV